MANNALGELRSSTVISTFGPGAIVDFRADTASVSAVVAGLESWDRNFRPPGLSNEQRTYEPRLQRELGVGGFRTPPVADEGSGNEEGSYVPALVARRFPEWLQCPRCDRIGPADRWAREAGHAYRYCGSCTQSSFGHQTVYAIPVRFLMACPKGHLEDFPWHYWVGHKGDCPKRHKAELYLHSLRPGLSGLVLTCSSCKASRSMDGIFSAMTWSGFGCQGLRPWLGTNESPCDMQPRVLQRGASNVYFPVIVSALSIPPWSDDFQEVIQPHWEMFVNATDDEMKTVVDLFLRTDEATDLKKTMSDAEIRDFIVDRVNEYRAGNSISLRKEEYNQFIKREKIPQSSREFEIRPVDVPKEMARYFDSIVRVVRLREVRALRGFTRINPPGDENPSDISDLSERMLNWLPAIEVRGEGIFLQFNMANTRQWERIPDVVSRSRKINERWLTEWRSRYDEEGPELQITPRYLLVHTFAHVLMRQLTIECGYSAASLRERVYVGEDVDEMAGLLIFTGTSDSDGTLGGLQRQGEINRIRRTVEAALKATEWCSTDPLCIAGMASGADSLSFAACHACSYMPETSCEQFNRFLDRGMLVGTPENPALGFFRN